MGKAEKSSGFSIHSATIEDKHRQGNRESQVRDRSGRRELAGRRSTGSRRCRRRRRCRARPSCCRSSCRGPGRSWCRPVAGGTLAGEACAGVVLGLGRSAGAVGCGAVWRADPMLEAFVEGRFGGGEAEIGFPPGSDVRHDTSGYRSSRSRYLVASQLAAFVERRLQSRRVGVSLFMATGLQSSPIQCSNTTPPRTQVNFQVCAKSPSLTFTSGEVWSVTTASDLGLSSEGVFALPNSGGADRPLPRPGRSRSEAPQLYPGARVSQHSFGHARLPCANGSGNGKSEDMTS